jgi:hypothetical protein
LTGHEELLQQLVEFNAWGELFLFSNAFGALQGEGNEGF